MVFRLKILWRGWWFGKRFSINFKKILPILVLTFWLNGGLNQNMFRLLFLLVFTFVWAYDIYVLYPHSGNDFSYNSFALSNSSLLQDNSYNLLFIIFGRSFYDYGRMVWSYVYVKGYVITVSKIISSSKKIISICR